MIRFRDLVFEDYFIDEHTAVITDKDGNVVEQHLSRGYYYVNLPGVQARVHQIQAHTKFGYYKGIDVHHLDEDSLNNDIENLVYLTKQDHTSITIGGRVKSPEWRANLAKAHIGLIPSEETRQKRRIAMTGKKDSDEVKKKKSEAGKKAWEKRKAKLLKNG